LSGSIYVGGEAPPVALRGRRSQALSLENEADLKLVSTLETPLAAPEAADDLTGFVQRAVDQSYAAARQFSASPAAQAGANDGYPASKLGQKLRLISKLLKLGGRTRLYYASQSGYDTHSTQASTHAQLLREFAAALKAFLGDLQAAQLDDRVVVLTFSEFGRRVEENASAGTDHGVAGPVFLAGSPVRGGVLNAHPSLADLDSGDLKMQVDFREIYAALLQNWLAVPSDGILKEPFAPFDCLRAK
jgi:uncharacterized protein (DUF1501 family)